MAVERIIPGTKAWRESHATHAERYKHACLEVNGLDILDAACGIGYGSHMLAEAGAKSVTGVDVSAETVEQARGFFSHPNVRFLQADCMALPFEDNSFDQVVSLETIEHLTQPGKFLDEIARVLRPGGRVVLSCPNSLTHSRSTLHREENPFHHNEMTLPELRALVEQRFAIKGWYHQSPSLTQTVARNIENLNLCLDRSLWIKLENLVRKVLGKAQLVPLQTIPSLKLLMDGCPQPVAPIPTHDEAWEKEAHVFVVNAKLKD